jgi:branched-chain amino acid aminotransferase
MKIWIDGRFIDSKEAKVSIFNRGFLYGDGVFETMRSYGGAVFRLKDHLDRLASSLRVIRLKIPYSKGELERIVYKAMALNSLKEAYIRVSVSRGEGRIGIDTNSAARPTVTVVARKFVPYPAWMYAKGISAKVVSIRQNESSPISRIKPLSFLTNILARLEAKSKGCDDAILMNTKDQITEGATSNLFLVAKAELATPSVECGILAGITRGVVMDIAKRLAFRVKEGRITAGDLMRANEVFLTNSLCGILPVTRIDGKIIGDRRPGILTGILKGLYDREAESAAVKRRGA